MPTVTDQIRQLMTDDHPRTGNEIVDALWGGHYLGECTCPPRPAWSKKPLHKPSPNSVKTILHRLEERGDLSVEYVEVGQAVTRMDAKRYRRNRERPASQP